MTNRLLLDRIECEIAGADYGVQWSMNWCAASIGIVDAELRGRCLALVERLDLFMDYPTPKGCTSPYLPSWSNAVVAKQAAARKR